MKMVKLGNSPLSVSPICFGSLTVGPLQGNLPTGQGAAVLAHGIRQGISFVDTAQLYETYPVIRRAMEITGSYDLVISSKTYAYTKEAAIEAVEQARKALNRDYIDIFMLHEQESSHTLRGHLEALDVLRNYKERGIIRAVGASMHHIAAVYGAVEHNLDVIHPLLNSAGLGIQGGSRQEMEQAVRYAHTQGLGVFSMKPLGGGNLFRRADECLHYVRGLDCVDSVAIGMQTAEEVDANIHFWKYGSFPPRALEHIEKRNRHLHIEYWCEGCGNCVKRCGQKALSIRDCKAHCVQNQCVLCGYCAAVCPAWAIKVI